MSYALNIRAEGYPRDVGPFPTREAAETWMAGRQLTGSWNTYPITPPEQAEPRCTDCRKCVGETAMAAAAAGDWWRSIPVGMVVCPGCGDKRCPRASHHENPCQQTARVRELT